MSHVTAIPKLTISSAEWEVVRQILQTYVPEYEVWAFGSRVTGRARAYSDLDLMLISDVPLPWPTRADVADAFTESGLPWKVDVVEWALTGERFREIVKESAIVVQRKRDLEKK